MSKAILILDEMPAGCPTCQLCHLSVNYNARMCGAAKLEMTAERGAYERRDDCPLHEMPERMYLQGGDYMEYNEGCVDGWNNCLDELEGKRE